MALEVLSYHNAASQEEVDSILLDGIEEPEMNLKTELAKYKYKYKYKTSMDLYRSCAASQIL